MPSIVLKGLTWSTPDGTTLFENLDLSFGTGRTGLVGRNGVAKSTLLKLVTGELSPASGSVTTNGHVAMLPQEVQVGEWDALADTFGIREQVALLDRMAVGRATAEQIAQADWTLLPRFHDALARVGLPELAPDHRLRRLSGGQRTRVALAAVLFREPDIILLDEPTTNLDRQGREAILSLLSSWRRGAVVVSHDRELLEYMDEIVELTTIGAHVYGGNGSDYRAQKAVELEATHHRLETAERRVKEIDRRLQTATERKARKEAAGRRKRKRGDAPKMFLDAQKERAEKTTSAQSQLANRMRQAAAGQAEEARSQIEKLKALSVSLSSTGLPKGKTVIEAKNLTGGYDPDKPLLRRISFTIVGPEHVAVIGPNGSGKTTLLRLLIGDLQPISGEARVHVRHAELDQAMSLLDPELTVRDNFLKLNPEADENTCRAALARFLFRADAALKPVKALSGGQILRAGLASVIGGRRPPELLLLDEPTNHLDLDSIQALEAGLSGYDGALVIISHDPTFLENIRIDRWLSLEAPAC
jgi:ATPase subunit of ABC transporter with duplicated ATPase domains